MGEQIKENNAESVKATVNKRKGLAMLAINDIVSVIQDARADTPGKIETALGLFENAVLPFLLNSSCTWLDISRTVLKSLNEIQFYFLRRVL